MNRLFILPLLLLAACGVGPSSPQRGDDLGNGGDPLAKRFERGRVKAMKILDKVLALEDKDAKLTSWYRENRVKLREDVQNTPAYQWTVRNANGACGSTGTMERAPIVLAYDNCQNVLTDLDAAIHLIGESVHHLGISEDSVSAYFSESIRRNWNRLLDLGSDESAKRILYGETKYMALSMTKEFRTAARPDALKNTSEEKWQTLQSMIEENEKKVMSLPIHWTDELPILKEEGSGCYSLSLLEMIFSYQGCEKDRKVAVLAWLEILTVGTDSSGIAKLIHSTWLSRGHTLDPHLKEIAKIEPFHTGPESRTSDVQWMGDELAAWSDTVYEQPESKLGFYSPEKNLWTYEMIKNPLAGRKHEKLSDWEPLGKSLVIGGRPALVFNHMENEVGLILDRKNKAWDVIPGFPSLSKRFNPVIASHGESLAIWGGHNFSYAQYKDGAIWNNATRTWETIPPLEKFASLSGETFQAIFLEKKLVVWGAFPTEEGSFVAGGAIFDPATRRWTLLPSLGNQLAWESPRLFWTGNELLVIGYELNSDTNLDKMHRKPVGWRWQEGALQMLPMDMQGAPDDHRKMYWNGNHLIAFGTGYSWRSSSPSGKTSRYYPELNKWVEQEELFYVPAVGTSEASFRFNGYTWVEWSSDTKNASVLIFP